MRRLTPARLEEYRRKSVCFICDGPYTIGHKCKNKHLLLMEVGPEEEIDGEEEILFEPKGE